MDVVTLTESALKEVARLIEVDGEENLGLRLAIKGGGCSGLSYLIDLDIKGEMDVVQDVGDFKVFMDRKSSLYLKGVTLDFSTSLQDGGFKFDNPSAKNTCGCGSSFSV